MWLFLSKLIMKKYLILAAILLGAYFINDYFSTKKEEKREQANRENLQRELQNFKNDMIQYQADGKNELKEYMENTSGQLEGLQQDLKDNNIKLKQVRRIVSSTINYRDTTSTKIVLDSISNIIRMLSINDTVPKIIKYAFEENNPCFWFKANLVIDDQELRVEINDRGYNDTITHVGYMERRQWKLFGLIKTRMFGKKSAKVTLFNNCGESKTIVIDNNK